MEKRPRSPGTRMTLLTAHGPRTSRTGKLKAANISKKEKRKENGPTTMTTDGWKARALLIRTRERARLKGILKMEVPKRFKITVMMFLAESGRSIMRMAGRN